MDDFPKEPPNKVVPLHKDKTTGGTMQGPARCMGCKHEWQAVAPAGTWELDCPNCTLPKGIFIWLVRETGYFWQCKCGGDVFMCTPHGALCVLCGLAHQYKDF